MLTKEVENENSDRRPDTNHDLASVRSFISSCTDKYSFNAVHTTVLCCPMGDGRNRDSVDRSRRRTAEEKRGMGKHGQRVPSVQQVHNDNRIWTVCTGVARAGCMASNHLVTHHQGCQATGTQWS